MIARHSHHWDFVFCSVHWVDHVTTHVCQLCTMSPTFTHFPTTSPQLTMQAVTIFLLHLLSTPFSFFDYLTLAVTCTEGSLFISALLFTWLSLWLFQEHMVTCNSSYSFHFDWTCVHLVLFIHALSLLSTHAWHASTLLFTWGLWYIRYLRSLHCPTHSDRTQSDFYLAETPAIFQIRVWSSLIGLWGQSY